MGRRITNYTPRYASSLAMISESTDVVQRSKVEHQAGRGMSFENLINQSNVYYEWKGIALIDKQQVRTQVVKKKDQPLKANVIGRSKVDYEGLIGVLNGKSIAFEAKSTSNKLFHVQMGVGKYDTIRRNQPEYLDQVLRFNGLAYWLIRFAKSDHAYMVPHTAFRKWANPDKVFVDVKVSEEDVAAVGYLVPDHFECHLDYLAPVIEVYKQSTGI